MPNGFRSIPSTEQRLEGVERKIDQIVAKLDMILDSMTKPAEKIELPQTTIRVKRENISPDVKAFLDHWANNPLSLGPSRPAALDVDDEYCSMKMPKGTEEEPKRMSGKPAKQQIEQWIDRNFKNMVFFKRLAEFGAITAKIEAKSKKADSTHKYTHRVKIKSTVMPGSFNPTIFGIDEAREVVAYLESLGVNVNTSALDNQ